MIGFQIALEKVGDQGIYQLHVFSIFILMMITISLAIMFPTYAYITPKLYCNGEICEQNLQTCSNEFTVDPNFQYSNYVTEFSLFCDNKKGTQLLLLPQHFLELLQEGYQIVTLQYYNSYLGQLRSENCIIPCSTIYNIRNFYYIQFHNYLLIDFREFYFGSWRKWQNCSTLCTINEICGTNLRQVFTMGLLVFWSFAEILLAYLFYIIFDWHTILLYFIIIPDIILFFLSFIIAESPKYYYGQQQYEKAVDALNFIAKYNQKPYLPQKCLIPIEQSKVHYHIFDLFRHPSLRYPSIGFMTISFCLHLIYYGAQFEIAFLIDSKFIYKIGAMLGLFELLTYLMMAQSYQLLNYYNSFNKQGERWLQPLVFYFVQLFAFSFSVMVQLNFNQAVLTATKNTYACSYYRYYGHSIQQDLACKPYFLMNSIQHHQGPQAPALCSPPAQLDPNSPPIYKDLLSLSLSLHLSYFLQYQQSEH